MMTAMAKAREGWPRRRADAVGLLPPVAGFLDVEGAAALYAGAGVRLVVMVEVITQTGQLFIVSEIRVFL